MGFEAHNAAELRDALENAHHEAKTFAIIDVQVERDDLSPVTREVHQGRRQALAAAAGGTQDGAGAAAR